MTAPAFATPLLLRCKSTSTRACVQHRRPVSATATSPASSRVRRSENVPGNYYVDSSCIDCDTCRWLAPETFHSDGGQSAVYSQPSTSDDSLSAARAALACPTGSIRTDEPSSASRAALSSFPLPVREIPSSTPVPSVFYNGFASPDTYGGASWLVLHDGPNPHAVMFDCPRFFRPLAKAIQRMAEPYGGVKYLVLSHRDDVAGHSEWAEALGAQRVIHKKECNKGQGTVDCEIQLEDGDFPYEVAEDVDLVHVPGHSIGSLAMLHKRSQSLFSGDHLAYSGGADRVTGYTEYISYSWGAQIRSVEKLADLPFLHMWPAHGRHFHYASDAERQAGIMAAADYMRTLECRLP